MDLEQFQKSFKNTEIDLKPYLAVVSIFISIILIIILINNKIEDYYLVYGNVNEKEVKITIDQTNLEKITKNTKVRIGKSIFTYKIKKIENYSFDDSIYKIVTIEIKNYNNNLLENDVINLKIIINKTNIFKYIFDIIKGE